MTQAERLLAEGLELEHAGDSPAAERAYHAAAELSPEWSVPFYNLGLMYKYQHRWRESLEFNKRATTLAPDDEAGWWNLGIAATALSDWKEARNAWAKCGMNPPDGAGPPDFGWGHDARAPRSEGRRRSRLGDADRPGSRIHREHSDALESAQLRRPCPH